MNKRSFRLRAAFTLIEIMLVVVIIGLIAAIGIPRLAPLRDDASRTTAKAYITSLETAIGIYEMNMGSLPPSLDALITNPSGSSKWGGPYMKDKKIKPDPWGQSYTYTITQDDYEIVSAGPPGKNSPISSND